LYLPTDQYIFIKRKRDYGLPNCSGDLALLRFATVSKTSLLIHAMGLAAVTVWLAWTNEITGQIAGIMWT